MSLINEALKKAQHQRAGPESTPPPLPGTPVPPRRAPRRRSLLWGFLVAVLVVGVFSAVTTTFLVYQILGPDETVQPAPEPVPLPALAEAQPVPPPAPEPELVSAPVAEAAAEPAAIAEPAPEAVAVIPPQEDATPVPLQAAPAAAARPQAAPPPVTAAAEAAPTEPPPAPAVAQSFFPPPVPVIVNPAVRARLEELEIRGVLNSGDRAKVLILDTTTGRSRSYKVGDLLQGPMSLRVAAINPGEIAFEDYGGAIHTKPF